jgi:hypothetical protein
VVESPGTARGECEEEGRRKVCESLRLVRLVDSVPCQLAKPISGAR